MNPDHAIDVYVDDATASAIVVRRRDSHHWCGSADARTLGSAVSEALNPKQPSRLLWQPGADVWGADRRYALVVVSRRDRQTIVATPFYRLGKIPMIVLEHSPRVEELGKVILAQARLSAEVIAALDQQERIGDFDAGELDIHLAEGERSIQQDGTLDGEEAFQQRRQRRADKRRPATDGGE